jgi:hypothetical protein
MGSPPSLCWLFKVSHFRWCPSVRVKAKPSVFKSNVVLFKATSSPLLLPLLSARRHVRTTNSSQTKNSSPAQPSVALFVFALSALSKTHAPSACQLQKVSRSNPKDSLPPPPLAPGHLHTTRRGAAKPQPSARLPRTACPRRGLRRVKQNGGWRHRRESSHHAASVGGRGTHGGGAVGWCSFHLWE